MAVALSYPVPSASEPQESTILIVEDGLRQYAEIVGKVHGCDHNELGQIDALSKRIAAWRYPSWWDGLTGTREEYAAKLSASAQIRFGIGDRQGCDGMFTDGIYRTLMRQWEDVLAGETQP